MGVADTVEALPTGKQAIGAERPCQHSAQKKWVGQLKIAIERYFNEEERVFSENLQAMITKKFELELHYVYQSVLRYWLFVHVPVTYSMYILVLFHLVATYAFRGSH